MHALATPWLNKDEEHMRPKDENPMREPAFAQVASRSNKTALRTIECERESDGQ
jgi:hypothetical protein